MITKSSSEKYKSMWRSTPSPTTQANMSEEQTTWVAIRGSHPVAEPLRPRAQQRAARRGASSPALSQVRQRTSQP